MIVFSFSSSPVSWEGTFEVSEADSENAGGILVEYWGRNLALFYIADGVKAVAIASLAVAFFLPHPVSGIFGLSGAAASASDFVFHIVKVFCMLFVSSTVVRADTGRLAISRMVSVYCKYSLFISF
jgi:formate hydrogenlyase subunit 4